MNKEEIFKANKYLAIGLANRYGLNYGYKNEIEDITQIALLGLWKAIITYDIDGWKPFHIYAYKIITDEIYYYLRKVNKVKFRTISIDTIIYDDITIGDTLESTDYSVDEIMRDIELNELKESINRINPTEIEKRIWDLARQGLSQGQIADICNVDELVIERALDNIIKKVRGTYNG